MASKHDIQAKGAQIDQIDALNNTAISVGSTMTYTNPPATFEPNDLITEARAEVLASPVSPVRVQFAIGTALPITLSSAWGTDYALFPVPKFIIEYLTATANKWRQINDAQVDRQYGTDGATLTGVTISTNDDGTGHLADKIQITITA